VAKKKRSKRETIRGMTGHGELDPALWGLPEPPARDDDADGNGDEPREPDDEPDDGR
jgi:hypothetical protein